MREFIWSLRLYYKVANTAKQHYEELPGSIHDGEDEAGSQLRSYLESFSSAA